MEGFFFFPLKHNLSLNEYLFTCGKEKGNWDNTEYKGSSDSLQSSGPWPESFR